MFRLAGVWVEIKLAGIREFVVRVDVFTIHLCTVSDLVIIKRRAWLLRR